MSIENSEKSIKQTGNSIGIGVNLGDVTAKNIAGTIIHGTSEQGDVDEVAQEIRALLQRLETTFPPNTTSGKLMLTAEAVKKIEAQPNLRQRLIAALRQGGSKAFEKAIDHPVASFFVGAVEGWTKGI